MWVDLLADQAHSHEGVSSDDRGSAGEQAPEGVRAVAGEFHLAGDLFEGGLDPVAPFGDDFPQDRRHAVALSLDRREEHGGAAAGLGGREALPLNPLSASRSRGGGPPSSRSLPASRSLMAAGTIAQARTMRLPRSVLMARRNP